MVEILTLLRNPIEILLSGVIVGIIAKIFHRSFVIGFIAGIFPKIVLPFVSFIYFPYAFILLPILLYFLFIWILLRFDILKSLIVAILVYFFITFVPAFLVKEFLAFLPR